jgi:hypothetical protein
MGLAKKIAAVAVPVALVVGGVAYGVAHHHSAKDRRLGDCTTKVGRLTVILTDAQARNASLISAVAIHRGMPAHAATIAIAAALQESKLYNLRGGDRDSLGLFQQRPSQGWGTPAEILNPLHATNSFYDALARVPGYDVLPVTVAAQRVQRSGFPSAYAVYENDARALASALTGYSPAAFHCDLPDASGTPAPVVRRADAIRRALALAFGPVGVEVSSGSTIAVTAGSSPQGWALASYLVSRAEQLGVHSVTYDGRRWATGSNVGWKRTRSGASSPGVVMVG